MGYDQQVNIELSLDKIVVIHLQETRETTQQSASPLGAESPSIIKDLSGELQFLTGEDMKRLREERKEAIEQSSPFNSEVDQVEELRKHYE